MAGDIHRTFMKWWRMPLVWLIAAVMAVLLTASLASAQTFKTGDSVVVSGDTVTDGALFAAGTNVTIDGQVNGSVYCAGQTITIRGEVNGNVYCGGQTILLEGKVHGSVHLGGQSITIAGVVDQDVTLGGQTVVIQKQATVGRDLLGGTQTLTIDGAVKRDAVIGANQSNVNGLIGRNVNGQIGSLLVGPNGTIAGNVDFASENDPTIMQGGKITGTVKRSQPVDYGQQQTPSFMSVVAGFIFFYVLAIVSSLILVLLLPQIFHTSAVDTMKRPWHTVLAGFILVFGAPVLILLCFVTVVGIPLAFIAITVCILIALLSMPFAAYFVGHLIVHRTNIRKKPLLVMLIGISIVGIVYAIPILGFIMMLAVYLIGGGMIARGVVTRLPRPRYTIA